MTLATTEAALCSGIKTVLETVSNVGNVYTRERWAALIQDQHTIAVSSIGGSNVFRFWTISLIRAPGMDVPTRMPGSNRRGRLYTFTYRIRGVFGHNDEDDTETPAKVVVMDVMAALDESATLNATYYNVIGASLISFNLVQFGTNLVHLAEVEFAVEHIV